MQRKLTILLIEDDQIEVMKFNRILSKLDSKHRVIEANNGEEALKILEDKDNLPNIILLDLNMPKINGIEFLKILKDDEVLKYLPTIILTTSTNQKDMLECYRIGIAGYMVKPLKYEDYQNKLIKVLSYWSANELISV
ncbi:response regulator [Tenacibaculum jejuense]|uniref:Signal transduction response regulator, receiver domain n=1 Tax=Tenacibaculum jejuense TaxID=584609 RepID=A0A238UBS0_9FLAO|nr:response regulator [Tenacibaculum jejuense]SNR16505.1 Signal transduction response regulator, receiver domain [Tenacibaculum jejuense]